MLILWFKNYSFICILMVVKWVLLGRNNGRVVFCYKFFFFNGDVESKETVFGKGFVSFFSRCMELFFLNEKISNFL